MPAMNSSDPSCAGSLAMWVVVFDTLSHSQQLVNTVITAILFGIATSLAIASVCILAGQGIKRTSAALQLLTTLVLYASTATFTGVALRAAFATASQAEAAAHAIDACDVQAVFNPVEVYAVGDRMTCVQTGTLVVNILVGDAVVWWRVYMLWPGVKARRGILAVSAALLAATVALSVADTCGACNLDLSFVQRETGNGGLFSGTTLGVAAAGASLATNVVATCFTAYRAWIHVRSLKKINRKITLTGAERILVLVAESGFVYSAIWITVVVWQAGENNQNIFEYDTGDDTFWGVAGYFVNAGLVPIIAIYPMLIIVMVALTRVQADNTYVFSTRISFQGQHETESPVARTPHDSGSGISARVLVPERTSVAPESVESGAGRAGDSEDTVRGEHSQQWGGEMLEDAV